MNLKSPEIISNDGTVQLRWNQADRTITRVNPGKENLTGFNEPLSRSSNSSAGLLSSKDDALVKKTNSDLFIGFLWIYLNRFLNSTQDPMKWERWIVIHCFVCASACLISAMSSAMRFSFWR